MQQQPDANEEFSSLPLRGAWIEMLFANFEKVNQKVAPPAGSVD